MRAGEHPRRPVDVVAAVKGKIAEIAALEGRIDEARATLASYLEAVARTVRAAQPAASVATQPPRPRRGGHRRSHSALEHSPTAHEAAKIIRAAGQPLHVSVILTAMKRKGRAIKTGTLVSSLSRWVRSRAVFYRASPNVFGLLEMRRKTRPSGRQRPR